MTGKQISSAEKETNSSQENLAVRKFVKKTFHDIILESNGFQKRRKYAEKEIKMGARISKHRFTI